MRIETHVGRNAKFKLHLPEFDETRFGWRDFTETPQYSSISDSVNISKAVLESVHAAAYRSHPHCFQKGWEDGYDNIISNVSCVYRHSLVRNSNCEHF
jgi:hypothetical protein